MDLFTLSLISCFLLLAGGQLPNYDCNKNVPKDLQRLLLELINLRREPIPYIQNLPNLTYSCPLAKEAFTGVGTIIGIMHDGFTITRPFTTWSETLRDAVKKVPYKELWFPRARQVGCATFLATVSRGTRYLTLRCRFDTFGNNMRLWNI